MQTQSVVFVMSLRRVQGGCWLHAGSCVGPTLLRRDPSAPFGGDGEILVGATPKLRDLALPERQVIFRHHATKSEANGLPVGGQACQADSQSRILRLLVASVAVVAPLFKHGTISLSTNCASATREITPHGCRLARFWQTAIGHARYRLLEHRLLERVRASRQRLIAFRFWFNDRVSERTFVFSRDSTKNLGP